MATPRHLLVDPENECDYHLVSRCVRRAFLCGVDDYTGRDCSTTRSGWRARRTLGSLSDFMKNLRNSPQSHAQALFLNNCF